MFFVYRIIDSFETVLTNIVERENLTGNVSITGEDTALLVRRVSSVGLYILVEASFHMVISTVN